MKAVLLSTCPPDKGDGKCLEPNMKSQLTSDSRPDTLHTGDEANLLSSSFKGFQSKYSQNIVSFVKRYFILIVASVMPTYTKLLFNLTFLLQLRHSTT